MPRNHNMRLLAEEELVIGYPARGDNKPVQHPFTVAVYGVRGTDDNGARCIHDLDIYCSHQIPGADPEDIQNLLPDSLVDEIVQRVLEE